MAYLSPPIPPIHESHRWRPYGAPIHLLDNDSLLNVFYLYRPAMIDEDEGDDDLILEGGEWSRERWWYKLAHVCRRWRNLILGSASHLGLCLVCTYGTPVADMLAHSPPFPLIVDHVEDDHDITAKDEMGILLALEHRDRVRRIRLQMPVPNLQRVIPFIDDEFPILDYLYIAAVTKHNEGLRLPNTFQAPHLQHLVLDGVVCPIGSPLLIPAAGLVTLSLIKIHPLAYFRPNDLLERLSLMPQLETLGIDFASLPPSRDVERQLLHTPVMTHVTLSHLRWFGFKGASIYLEALLPQMTTPLLEKLQILFFNQLTYSIPHLLQFINTTENLTLSSANITFDEDGVSVTVSPHAEARVYALSVDISCSPVDWQVVNIAQILNGLGGAFSTVENLTLEYERYFTSLEWCNQADRTQWCALLRPFCNVKTLVLDGLSREFFHSLQLGDGESSPEPLPELKELSYFAIGDDDDPFNTFIEKFIDDRRNAGRPVTLVRRGTSPSDS